MFTQKISQNFLHRTLTRIDFQPFCEPASPAPDQEEQEEEEDSQTVGN